MRDNYSIVLQGSRKTKIPMYLIFACSGVLLLVSGKFLFGSLFIVIAILGYRAGRKPIVNFTSTQILFPSFINKAYSWNEVSNVILKDNILTIDLKNNKLLQSAISEESAAVINEAEFNAFCKQNLIS